MIEQELKEIWRSSSQAARIKFEQSRLLIALEGKMTRMEKTIRKRDLVETTTALLMIPVFGYFAYEIPFMVSKIGCILSMIWFGYVIFKLRDVKKHKLPVDLSLSFREQLENQKAYFLQEAKLIDDVFYWYLLPPFVAHAIVILGLGDPTRYGWSNPMVNEILPISLTYKVAYLAFAAVLYAGILWINKRTVRNVYQPLIKEIEKVQQQLQSEH